MQHFNTKELNTKQMYKFLTGSIIPRPIAWITTQNPETQVVNAAPFSFFSVASNVLPLISVAILRNDGKIKDSACWLPDKESSTSSAKTWWRR